MENSALFRPFAGSRAFVATIRVYGAIGAISAPVAFGYFLLRKFKIEIDKQDAVPLIITAVGLSLFVMSRLYLYAVKERQLAAVEHYKKDRLISSLLMAWSDLEKSSSDYFGEENSSKPVPVRHLLRTLNSSGVIDIDTVGKVESALNVRNKVAHGMSDEVSRDDLVRALDDITTVESLIVGRTIARDDF